VKSFMNALTDAFYGGEEGDAALAEVIAELPKDRQAMAAAVMGDMRGQFGADALRRIINTAASAESQGTALIALAKRDGFAAIDELVAALDSKDWRVQDAAVRFLAAIGDDRAWDRVFERLERRLRNPPRKPVLIDNSRDEVTEALSYLLPYVERTDGQRKTKIVSLLRSRWPHLVLSEQAWLEKYWPESRPDGPAPEAVGAPDTEAIKEWATAGLGEPTDWGPILRG
jgi:HEAT repeat protein